MHTAPYRPEPSSANRTLRRNPAGVLAGLVACGFLAIPGIAAAWQPATSSLAPPAGAPPSDLVIESAHGSVPIQPYADGNQLLLSNGYRFDPLQGEPALPANLTALPVGPGEMGSFLVQFQGPILKAQRAQLEASGARVISYLPYETFLVRMTGAVRAEVASMPFVRWVGAFHPAYKISGRPELGATSGTATLVVLLFMDADLAATRLALEAMGATTLMATETEWNKILRVSADLGHVAEIARRGEVAWIEPWHECKLQNNLAQWVVQTNVLNSRSVWDRGLHGEGQVIHSSDSGIRTSHNAFRDNAVPITAYGDYPTHRKVIAYKAGPDQNLFGDHSGASFHGTHTAGTMAGDDSPFATDLRDGNAKGAKLWLTDVGTTSTTVFVPDDMNLVFTAPYTGNAGGAARITSNSWGSPINNYDVLEMTVDQFMWNHKDFLAFFSNGNDFAPGAVGSPAGNKNGAGVGATMNGTGAGLKAVFSSEGPTQDGRRKPTIMAPGDGQSTPLSGVYSAYGANDTGYQALAGTSMASPCAAGATAVVRQYCTEGWYPSGSPSPSHAFTPSAALLKAMMMNSTDNDMTGHNIPDYTVGWGRIKTENVLYFPGDAARLGLVDETQGLETGEFKEYDVEVANPAVPLKVMLCWTDKEGSTIAARALVNDLDLTLTDPLGIPYVGNLLAGGQSIPASVVKDPINVEEGFRLNAPATGTWKVRVTAFDAPFGPQPFGLVINGGIQNFVTGVDDNQKTGRLVLEQSMPNPAGLAGAAIRFALPRAAHAELAIYSLDGRRVRTLLSGPVAAGYRTVSWNGLSDAGKPVASGVYFYRLVAGGLSQSRKLVVLTQ